MAQGQYNPGVGTAEFSKQYAASGSVRNLVADSPNGNTCARAVKILGGAGSFTSVRDGAGEGGVGVGGRAIGTIGPLAQGDVYTQSISELISADQAFIAYW